MSQAQAEAFDVVAALPDHIRAVIGEVVHQGTLLHGEALVEIVQAVANATANHYHAAGRAQAMAERLRVKEVVRDEAGLITRVIERDA